MATKDPRHPKRAPRSLTDQQFRVVTEYITNGFDKGAALLASGYTEQSARSHPDRVFNHPVVRAEIERRQEAANTAANLSQEWIITKLMTLATADERLAKYKKVQPDGSLMWDFNGATIYELQLVRALQVEFYTEGHGEFAKAVKKFKIDTTDPLAVLNSLARIAGLFNDRLQLEGDDEVVAILQSARKRISKDNDDG